MQPPKTHFLTFSSETKIAKITHSAAWVKNESAREYNAAALRVYFAPAFSAFKYESEFTTYTKYVHLII